MSPRGIFSKTHLLSLSHQFSHQFMMMDTLWRAVSPRLPCSLSRRPLPRSPRGLRQRPDRRLVVRPWSSYLYISLSSLFLFLFYTSISLSVWHCGYGHCSSPNSSVSPRGIFSKTHLLSPSYSPRSPPRSGSRRSRPRALCSVSYLLSELQHVCSVNLLGITTRKPSLSLHGLMIKHCESGAGLERQRREIVFNPAW